VDNGTNPFGGGNPSGLYVPLTDDERDAIDRARDRGVLVKVRGLGVFPATTLVVGDHRVSVGFVVKTDVPRTLSEFSHSVETEDGIVLASETIPCLQQGRPLHLQPGEEVEMEIHISLTHLDPKLLRCLRPMATGLTSRRIDRDTGDFSFAGNMKNLSEEQRKLLRILMPDSAGAR